MLAGQRRRQHDGERDETGRTQNRHNGETVGRAQLEGSSIADGNAIPVAVLRLHGAALIDLRALRWGAAGQQAESVTVLARLERSEAQVGHVRLIGRVGQETGIVRALDVAAVRDRRKAATVP